MLFMGKPLDIFLNLSFHVLPLVISAPKILISCTSLVSGPIAMAVVPFPDLHPDYGIPCHRAAAT
ncbi:hypothetical protein HOLleu_39492 [Holothuria leucospilota]|uniref:Uncharacterized protein n=1 Tax=Holothuria leucospilota TaxID=206669 RepID=A0A9Q1BEW8_HOLLE|nr:hypothetical protein HOLleu_39492 [Holothuria leucospilota]